MRWLRIVGFVGVAVVWLTLHAPSLAFGFVSDDYCMLMKPSLLPNRGWYRYSPLSLALWRVLGLAGDDPWVFRAAALVFHAGVTGLVFELARRLQGNPWTGLLAVALFVGRPEHHEVVYWSAAGLFYLPMAAAVLGALCLSAREPAVPWRRYAVAYPLLTAAACLTHESGVFVLLALLTGELFSTHHRKPGLRLFWRVGRLLPSFFPAIALIAVKHTASAPLSPMLSRTAIEAAVIEVAHATKALFVPFLSPRPQWVPHFEAIFALSLGGLLLPVLLLLARREGRKYAGLYLVSVVALLAARLHAALQDRFLYLPSALLSCLTACGILWAVERYLRREKAENRPIRIRRRAWIGAAASGLVAIAGLAYQVPRLTALRRCWSEAGRWCQTIVDQSVKHLKRFPADVEEVYFLDPPDHVPVPVTRALSPAYVFRTGITEALWRAQREEGRGMRPRVYHVWPLHHRDPPTSILLARAERDQSLRILAWNPQTLVVMTIPEPRP